MKIKRNVLAAGVATLLGLGLAASASARTFSGSIAAGTGFGLPIPVLQSLPGGTACPTCNTTIPTAQATSDEDLAVPSRAFYLITGPNAFPLPQPTSYPFLTSSTFATFSNDSGTLKKGSGPGTFTFCAKGLPCAGAGNNVGTPGRLRVDMVGEQFGGVMRLAGVFNDRITVASPPGKLIGTLPIPLSGLGGPIGATVTASDAFVHTVFLTSTPVYATITNMPWTTGRLRVDDNGGQVPEAPITTTGTDLRNSTGGGSIQLVTGWLAHVTGAAPDDTTGRAVMTLNLPEPTSTLMLASGLSLLFGLHWFARRR